MKLADLHSHTALCNHAAGTPLEYFRAAERCGLSYLGVSDHAPWPSGYDSQWRMRADQFPEYRSIVRDLQQYARDSGSPVEVLYGLEADWVPGRMDEVQRGINGEPFDYLIGSVHVIDGFPFDDPAFKPQWRQLGVDHLWERYTELLLELVNHFDFQILAHPDLPKKFGYYHSNPKEIESRMKEVFRRAAEKGIALELNTAGLRKDAKEIYPSLSLVRCAFESGMSLTLGGDSHVPEEVGWAFPQALELAKAAGYRSACAFRAKQRLELSFD